MTKGIQDEKKSHCFFVILNPEASGRRIPWTWKVDYCNGYNMYGVGGILRFAQDDKKIQDDKKSTDD